MSKIQAWSFLLTVVSFYRLAKYYTAGELKDFELFFLFFCIVVAIFSFIQGLFNCFREALRNTMFFDFSLTFNLNESLQDRDMPLTVQQTIPIITDINLIGSPLTRLSVPISVLGNLLVIAIGLSLYEWYYALLAVILTFYLVPFTLCGLLYYAFWKELINHYITVTEERLQANIKTLPEDNQSRALLITFVEAIPSLAAILLAGDPNKQD